MQKGRYGVRGHEASLALELAAVRLEPCEKLLLERLGKLATNFLTGSFSTNVLGYRRTNFFTLENDKLPPY